MDIREYAECINVYGESLYNDINAYYKPLKQVQQANKCYETHTVEFTKESILYNIFADKTIANSYHHQVIKDFCKHAINFREKIENLTILAWII